MTCEAAQLESASVSGGKDEESARNSKEERGIELESGEGVQTKLSQGVEVWTLFFYYCLTNVKVYTLPE